MREERTLAELRQRLLREMLLAADIFEAGFGEGRLFILLFAPVVD